MRLGLIYCCLDKEVKQLVSMPFALAGKSSWWTAFQSEERDETDKEKWELNFRLSNFRRDLGSF